MPCGENIDLNRHKAQRGVFMPERMKTQEKRKL